jgi:ATP-binding cassette subfamily C protein
LVVIALIVAAILVFMGALQIIRSFILAQIGIWLEKKIEPVLIDKTIDTSVHNHTIGSSLVRDLNTIKSFLGSPALTSMFDAPWAIIYFIVIFFIHPINGFITVIGAIILFILAYINEKVANKKLKTVNEMQMAFFNKTGALTNSSEAIIAMGMKGNIVKRFAGEKEKMRTLSYHASATSFYVSTITKIVRMFIQILTMAVGAVLVINNKMSPGGIIATSILAGKALAPFDALVTMWQQFINVKKSYQRINEVIAEVIVEDEKTQLPEPQGILKLDKIAYRANDTKKVIIKSADIEAKPGEVIAVIGPSGGGKTTLGRIMAGIIEPSAGKVTIDGSKLQNYNREMLGEYIGYLPQQVEFISGTIKENIARMAGEIDDKLVVEAAQDAGAHQIIQNFEKGYDTHLENLGKNLSAGQKQRIALARCFYGKTKIMILDEPNSNLDAEGERALVRALLIAKKKNVTVIVMSHRTAILEAVDKILVMHQGAVQYFDERDKVLAELNKKKDK